MMERQAAGDHRAMEWEEREKKGWKKRGVWMWLLVIVFVHSDKVLDDWIKEAPALPHFIQYLKWMHAHTDLWNCFSVRTFQRRHILLNNFYDILLAGDS